MSKILLKIPKYLFLLILSALNLLSVAGMNICAYSAWLQPQHHPNMSYLGLMFPAFLTATLVFVPVWFILGVLGLKLGKRRRQRRAYWGMLFSLVGMACCAGSIRTYFPLNLRTEPPAGALKVVSYNVFSLSNPDNLPWAEHPTVRFLIDCKADIVCIQEAGALNRDYVDSLLAEAYPYRRYDKVNQMACACLSRWPIVGATPIDYESAGNGSLAYDIVVGDDTLLVINNHLESYRLQAADREEYKDVILRKDSTDIRRNILDLREKLTVANVIRGPQADSVGAFIDSHRDRFIICCGDFNDASISYTHHRLTRYLNDAYTRSGNGAGISYNRSGMYFRIDNILCSPRMRAYGACVDNSVKTSDHYPIYCWLTLSE